MRDVIEVAPVYTYLVYTESHFETLYSYSLLHGTTNIVVRYEVPAIKLITAIVTVGLTLLLTENCAATVGYKKGQ